MAETAQANVNAGIVLYESGEIDNAIDRFRKALSAKPDFPEAHNNLGNALLGQGKPDEALACFSKALALKPDYALAWINMGNALREQLTPHEAIVCYEKAIAIDPNSFAAHYNLGNAFLDFGKPEQAVASYLSALGLSPGVAEAHNNLGVALQELGRIEEATASIRTALVLRPGFAQAHFNLHSLLLDPDDLRPSIQCLKEVVKLTPDDTLARFNLGMLLDCAGDMEAAANHFELASKGTPLARACLDSYRYLKSANRKLPRLVGCPIQAFRVGVEAAVKEGLVLEFGVRFGTSIRQIAALVGQEVHGFDSFEGLPESWHEERRGSYSTLGALPNVPKNVFLHKGAFEDTLPGFMERHRAPVRFMNIDCDLYSSTRTVLELLGERIVPGTILVFDEYFGHEHWRDDEFKAFQEAVIKNHWNYDYVCFSNKQAVLRIT